MSRLTLLLNLEQKYFLLSYKIVLRKQKECNFETYVLPICFAVKSTQKIRLCFMYERTKQQLMKNRITEGKMQAIFFLKLSAIFYRPIYIPLQAYLYLRLFLR